tara:strand:+ start:2007 stop:2330 length:324 start_codon:yes stop_codon:yes gene_type:complete
MFAAMQPEPLDLRSIIIVVAITPLCCIARSVLQLFVTLIRFEAAYHELFKCNRNMLNAMPYLHAFMQRIYTIHGIAETVNIGHNKARYCSIKSLNASGILPVGPAII